MKQPVSQGKDPAASSAGSSPSTRLQKGLLRLAFTYYGQDPTLDRQLDEIRGLVRASAHRSADVQDRVEAIVDTILSLDTRPEVDLATSSALSLVEGLRLPDAASQRIQDITARLQQNRSSDQIPGLLAEITGLLNELLSTDMSARYIGEIKDPLHALLRQVTFPLDRVDEQIALEQKLADAASPEAVHSVIESLATLLNSVNTQLKADVSSVTRYLGEIVGKLHLMEKSLSAQQTIGSESSDEARDFNESFHNEVSELQESMANSPDITDLKSRISDRLGSIQSLVTRHIDNVLNHNNQLNREIDVLKDRLVDLEQSTETLQNDLDHEHRRAYTDSLTGCSNRLAYDERVKLECLRWQRSGEALSLAIIDLDHFKQVNDQFGHIAGDKVLCNVGKIIRSRVRKTDFFARYGGEEFVLLLPSASAKNAHRLCDLLREAIGNTRFHYKEQVVPVSISCGITEFRDADDAQIVFERADKLLYEAKSAGRNNVRSDADS